MKHSICEIVVSKRVQISQDTLIKILNHDGRQLSSPAFEENIKVVNKSNEHQRVDEKELPTRSTAFIRIKFLTSPCLGIRIAERSH